MPDLGRSASNRVLDAIWAESKGRFELHSKMVELELEG